MPVSSLAELQERAKKLKETQRDRDAMYDEMDNMYLLVDSTLPTAPHIKPTISPDARNAIQGGTRILAGTYPKWACPAELNTSDVDNLSSLLERLAMATWVGSCRVQRKLVHKEACLSAMLYSEVHIAVKSTKTLAAGNSINKKRADAALLRTPVLFEVLPARACYAEYDQFGLSGHYMYRKAFVNQIIAAYGKPAEAALEGKQASELVNLSEWWDENTHAVWLEEAGQEILVEDNPYEYIPIAAATAEGSDMFQKQGQATRQPMLYGLWKSNAWQRKNLALTVNASMVFAIGANPQMVFKSSNPEAQTDVDYSLPGGVIHIANNESLEPLSKVVVDPSLLQLMATLDSIDEESTIYKQALGQPLGGNAPFSMVSMLSQAGRLPLVIYQRVLSFVFGDAMQIALKIIKEDGIPKSMTDSKGKIVLKSSDIPDTVEIECTLEVDLPQDQRQNAQIAIQLAGGEDAILSKERVAKEYLQVEQYDEEVKRKWREKMQDQEMRMAFMQREAQLQMQMQQQAMQMQQQGAQGGPGMPPPGMDQGMPPGGPQGMPPGMPPQGPPQGQPTDQFGDFAAQMQGAPGSGLPALPMTSPVDQGQEQGLPGNPMEQMQGGF